MKKIQVLGAGCSKCEELTKLTKSVADSLGIQYELEKVTDIKTIMGFGVMTTPALVVDGVVKFAGKLPTAEQIKQVIQ
jgi:small redox-active disulfide protein 2